MSLLDDYRKARRLFESKGEWLEPMERSLRWAQEDAWLDPRDVRKVVQPVGTPREDLISALTGSIARVRSEVERGVEQKAGDLVSLVKALESLAPAPSEAPAPEAPAPAPNYSNLSDAELEALAEAESIVEEMRKKCQ